jgi:hypothetical protein
MSNLSGRSRIIRFLGGLAVVVIILVTAFALLPVWIHRWGATEEEIARRMPGDELLPDPTLVWTQGFPEF